MEDSSTPSRYQALLRAARAVFNLNDLEDIVDQVLNHSLDMMQAEACSMYIPDPSTQELIIYSAKGRKDSAFHTVRIPWDKGIAGLVFQKREIVKIDDADNDPRVFKQVAQKGGFVTRAMLTMPLVDKDECFGVLQAINPKMAPAFTDLDQEILEGLGSIVTSSLLRLEREKRALEEAKISQELSVAHEIQQSFLPDTETVLPRAEVRVRYQPARTIGGDFYAVIPLQQDRVLVALGDVSGKGIPAALTTAQVTGEMNALASTIRSGGLAEYVVQLNKGLCGRLAAGRFVATTFLLYDPHAQTMDVVSAGQFEPWRWKNDDWEVLEVPRAMPLGVFKDYKYETTTFPCAAGEKWIMFSDGINEGRNDNEEEYGFDRLKESMEPGHPERNIETAWATWSKFVNPTALHDDACLVLLATHPPSFKELASEPACCKHARGFIESWATLAGFSDIERGQIVLAADEAFTNVIRHAYKGIPGQRITLRCDIRDGMFSLRIRDYGPRIEKEKMKGRELEDVKPGGLGLQLLDMIFSHVEYCDMDPGTELWLSKALPGHTMPAGWRVAPEMEAEAEAEEALPASA